MAPDPGRPARSIRQRIRRDAIYLGVAAALGLPWFLAIALLGGQFVRVNLAPWPAVLAGAVVTTVIVAAAVRPLVRLGWRGMAVAVLVAPHAGGTLLPGLALVADDPSLLLRPLELVQVAIVYGAFGALGVLAWALVVYPLALGTVCVLFRVDEALEGRRLPLRVSARPRRL